jgi:hypothetical protein
MVKIERSDILLDRALVILAIFILILNFLISPVFFKQSPDNTGTFIGLSLLSISVIRLIDKTKEKK